MHKPTVKPAFYRRQGDDLAISTEIMRELMQEVLAKGALFRFRAKGWSMSPFIKDGDAITISPINKQEKPAVGKVVALIQPETNQLVVHRVIGRRGLAYLIQGDNAAGRPDGFVLFHDILGCVTRVEREGHLVYLGLGLERYIITILSRNKFLIPLINRLRAMQEYFTD